MTVSGGGHALMTHVASLSERQGMAHMRFVHHKVALRTYGDLCRVSSKS